MSTDFSNDAGIGELQIFWVHLSLAGLMSQEYDLASDTFSFGDANNSNVSLDGFFPKDTLGKEYLVPIVLNNQTFLSTGLIGLNTHRKLTLKTPVLKASQAQYIHHKANGNLDINIDTNPNHFDCFNTGQKMYPTAEYAGQGFSCSNSSSSNSSLTVPSNVCVESDGSGGYRYTTDGLCNMIWRLDY